MSIESQIQRLQGVKSSIIESIRGKGIVVPDTTMLDECPSLIDAIPQGGGGKFIVTSSGHDYYSYVRNSIDLSVLNSYEGNYLYAFISFRVNSSENPMDGITYTDGYKLLYSQLVDASTKQFVGVFIKEKTKNEEHFILNNPRESKLVGILLAVDTSLNEIESSTVIKSNLSNIECSPQSIIIINTTYSTSDSSKDGDRFVTRKVDGFLETTEVSKLARQIFIFTPFLGVGQSKISNYFTYSSDTAPIESFTTIILNLK